MVCVVGFMGPGDLGYGRSSSVPDASVGGAGCDFYVAVSLASDVGGLSNGGRADG